MAKQLHPKILALRNKIGYKPIYEFTPNMKQYSTVPLEKRSINTSDKDNPRKIKQYFAIWGVADDYGTRPMPGCFNKSISDRGPASKAPNKIVVLNQHRQFSPLCLPDILQEDDIGLYGEYVPDEGIQENDDLVTRIKKGTINGGSYGFNHVWDKMEYDDKKDEILMYDVILYEVSPVTLPSQLGTHVVRSLFFDSELQEETEKLLKKIPRQHHLEIRGLIARHISLAQTQPLEKDQRALSRRKPKQRNTIDFDYLIENLNF